MPNELLYPWNKDVNRIEYLYNWFLFLLNFEEALFFWGLPLFRLLENKNMLYFGNKIDSLIHFTGWRVENILDLKLLRGL